MFGRAKVVLPLAALGIAGYRRGVFTFLCIVMDIRSIIMMPYVSKSLNEG